MAVTGLERFFLLNNCYSFVTILLKFFVKVIMRCILMKEGNSLNQKILTERQRLECLAQMFGLKHPSVIKQSEKLDKLIYTVQKG